jgi:exopolyphosphatase / guanosine-5'-triphosphate,3'-diphosphate pyrophosphatase
MGREPVDPASCHHVSQLRIDIAEASTHFSVTGSDERQEFSIPLGAEQLTTDELDNDPPRAEELSNAIAMVQAHLDDVLRELPAVTRCDQVISSSAFVRVISAVERGDRVGSPEVASFLLTRAAAEDVYRTLATERLADRIHNPGLPREAAKTILGACCIVVGIMRRLHLADIEVRSDDGDISTAAAGAGS